MSTGSGRIGIAERVKARFPSSYTVEVSVLDGSGDSFEVYAGPVMNIAAGHFVNIFREPGCFYVFTVIGISEELTNAVDVHHSNIRRAQFVWLTDPAPPRLVRQGSFDATIAWESFKFCGINPFVPPECVNYVFEMAEGCEWKDGKVARFVTDLTVESYRQLLVVNKPKSSLHVTDLQPGMHYYARIALEYLGERVVSEALCFHASPTAPSAPGIPRAYVTPIVNYIDPSTEYPPNITLKWSCSKTNGEEITKYQVMMQHVVLSSHFVDSTEPYSPLFAKKLKHVRGEKKILRGGRWIALPEPAKKSSSPARCLTPQFRDDAVVFSQWTQIYSNLDRKVKLCSPPPGTIEWKFRVRAKNACGWSELSPTLSLHNRSHPDLFKSEYPSDYCGDGLSLCSYPPSSPTPLQIDAGMWEGSSSSPPSHLMQQLQQQQYQYQYHLEQQQQQQMHHQLQQQSQRKQQIAAPSDFHSQGDQQSFYILQQQQRQQQQQLQQQQYDEAFPYDEELIEASDRSGGFAFRRPRATSALPSTSHDRRESFSSEAGGGISAPNSRIMDASEHGLDTHSGLLSGDRNAIGSRGRSAGARL